jgi:hypothetical protein
MQETRELLGVETSSPRKSLSEPTIRKSGKVLMNNDNAEQPRLTIRTMADYLTANGAHQRFSILQNMKGQLGRRHFAPYYQDARSAVREYHSGIEDSLDTEIQRLLRARHDEHRPVMVAKYENNIRVISDYRDNFGATELVHQRRRFEPLLLNGVRISTEPTLSGTLQEGRDTFNCNIMVDPQAEEADEAEIDYILELLDRGSSMTHPTPIKGSQ